MSGGPLLLKYGASRHWILREDAWSYQTVQTIAKEALSTIEPVVLATNHPSYGSPEDFTPLPTEQAVWDEIIKLLDVIWVFDNNLIIPPPKTAVDVVTASEVKPPVVVFSGEQRRKLRKTEPKQHAIARLSRHSISARSQLTESRPPPVPLKF